MAVKPVVICLSRAGEPVARRIADALGVALHGRKGRVGQADAFFPNALDHARDLFLAGTPVIGVCAAGILVRAVGPHLADKRAEPPVIAVPDDGSTVIPLVGGHHGANRLARRIAEILSARAAVTTAGDVALGVALDEPPAGWHLANPENAKAAMMALLQGGGARITGEAAAEARWLADLPGGDEVEIICTTAPVASPRPTTLVYHPQVFALGVGCARNCPADELARLVRGAVAEADVAVGALAAVGTLDLKADEGAVLDLARALGLPLRLFDAGQLEEQAARLARPSDVVFAEVGCHGVAEGAALALAGEGGELAVTKRKSTNATCALARAVAPITALRGRARGRLAIIGIGPGQAAWRTPEASRLIAEADELVGYGLYLDLLGPLAAGKARRDFPLGGEEDRCRYALEAAGEGRNVALICSGDAGIYAMGALVYELLDRGAGLSDAARRVEVISAPGISALQAAAARAGAPLGHDFCAISLSDLLTPREDILGRIKAAAEGDFVIAFYNPVSRSRRDLLALARDMLLQHRPADTPVMLATNLGREGERLRMRPLEALQVDEVDMLTVVLVGSSNSTLVARGDGARMYTPRGYARKMKGAS